MAPWGQFSIHLQAAAHIMDCWDTLQGKVLTTNPLTYNLLAKPVHPGAQASTVDLALYNTTKAVWNKKNAQALGLTSHMAKLHPIWHSKRPVGCLRGWIWKSRGSIDLPPIGQHGENPIHRFNGSVASDPTISQIQQITIESHQMAIAGFLKT